MSKSIYSYIRKEYECYKDYSDSTIEKLLPNWCSVLKSLQNDLKKEYEEKLQKSISALKIEIDYPECTLINSRGDTFTFKNNSRNEELIDFLSFHEEGLKSLL